MNLAIKFCILFFTITTCLVFIIWFHVEEQSRRYILFGLLYLYTPLIFITCSMIRIFFWPNTRQKLSVLAGNTYCGRRCGIAADDLTSEEITTLLDTNPRLTSVVLWKFRIRNPTIHGRCGDSSLLQFLLTATPDARFIRYKFRSPLLCEAWVKDKECDSCEKMEEILFGSGLLPSNSYDDSAQYTPVYDNRTLSHFSRLSIRRAIHPNMFYGAERLPLPRVLQTYLVFRFTMEGINTEVVSMFLTAVRLHLKEDPKKCPEATVVIVEQPLLNNEKVTAA